MYASTRCGVPLLQAPDHGPVYTETDFSRAIVEPLNASSAALFLGLAALFARRLRARQSRLRFLAWCVPLLAIGGVGGMLYHALRVWRGFLLMDFVPIVILCVAAGIYVLSIVLRSTWRAVAVIGAGFAIQGLLLRAVRSEASELPRQAAVNASYAVLALLVAGPMLAYLVRVNGAATWRVLLALGSFAVALLFRFADSRAEPLFSFGTHWLWHVFGAIATYQCFEFVRQISLNLATQPVPPASHSSLPPS